MLDGAVVLLDDVVEVFNLAHKDRHFAAGVDRIDRSLASAALVHRDPGQITVRSPWPYQRSASLRPCRALPSAESRRFFAACRQRGRGIFRPLNFDVRFMPAPAAADRALPFLRHPLSAAEKESPSGLWMNGLTHRALP